ncbi:DNA topoisomerase 2-alpha [Araneus ventricosus]|uniref:DNA topoisomerase 2 n=1 Tax=Araneus ventricosus TaxID=182803 RepID=A0A4Y2ME72_ARAVE|nr:DNA topoisomerase 2-alpha [Araneus ventricosus]
MDKKNIKEVYTKHTSLEHILLRPDTYIGSLNKISEEKWILETAHSVKRNITFSPGLLQIFDEILLNACDNKTRDKNMNVLKIHIDQKRSQISIFNNGKCIPIEIHEEENCYIPTLLFKTLLTSSNYDDKDRKLTAGRNGFGAKLCNIFSKKLIVETASKDSEKKFTQIFEDNMKNETEPDVQPYLGSDFTRITFYPDLDKFFMTHLDSDIICLMSKRAFDIAGCTPDVKVILNDKTIPVRNFKDYVDLYFKGNEDVNEDLKIMHTIVNDRWEIAVTLSDSGPQHTSFVNSIATNEGGSHVKMVIDKISSKILDIIRKKWKNFRKAGEIQKYLWAFINFQVENPAFYSQIKDRLTTPAENFSDTFNVPQKFVDELNESGMIEIIISKIKSKAEREEEKKRSGKKVKKLKGISKLEEANLAASDQSRKCTLILTEGDSAKSLAVSGLSVIGRDKYRVFPLKGKNLM